MKLIRILSHYTHTHTHTHTLAIVMLAFLRCVSANAQAGNFTISGFVNDPTTATTRCTINWEGLVYTSLEALDITISTIGLDDCINDNNAPNPTVIHAGFSAPNYTIQFTNTTLKIKRDDPFSTFAVPPSPYMPFVVLSFRAMPSSQVTVNAAGSIVNPSGTPLLIGSDNVNWTVSGGANFIGDLTKPDGLGCTDLGASGFYIPGVTVTKTADVSASACFPGAAFESNLFPLGVYNFDNTPFNEPYIISASKTGTNMCCGITSNDQAWMQEAILSPQDKLLWKILAADFNGNGVFSTYDIFLVRKCILGQVIDMPVGWKPWRFTPWHNNSWAGDNPMRPIAASEVGTLNDIPSDIKVTPNSPFWGPATSFWGVKRGDVDGDCQNCESNFTSNPTDDRSKILIEKAFIADRSLEAGQEAFIPVYVAQNVHGVRLFGIEILFNNKILDVVSVENGDLNAEEAMHHIVPEQNGISVRYSWISYEPASVPENTVLFYVKVRAKQALKSLRGLFWQELGNDVNALFTTEKKERMAFEVDLAPEKSDKFNIRLIGANPVMGEAQLDLLLPAELTVNVSLIDSKGVVARNFSQELPSGQSSIMLADLPQAPGVYTILVQTPAGQGTLRFVKL